MPQPSLQKQAVAEFARSTIAFDDNGDEIQDDEPSYDDYLNSMPSREERRRFKTPLYYWEVKWPGCTLQPYPRLGSFRSTESGAWRLEYPYQEKAVREHILSNAGVDPDLLKISDDELAVMDGRKTGTMRYCQNAGCVFVSCSALANDLHEALTGHRTDRNPRKDR